LNAYLLLGVQGRFPFRGWPTTWLHNHYNQRWEAPFASDGQGASSLSNLTLRRNVGL
jgi:hypothetical protein